MSFNHGQEIAVNEFRMKAKAVRDRLAWSLIIGAATMVALVAFAGPEGLVTNVIQYGWSLICLEWRKLPLFGVRQSDIVFVARSYVTMARQYEYWWYFGIISALAATSVSGLFTYTFFKRGEREKLDLVTRGSQLVTPKIHNKIMKKEYGKKPPFEMGRPLTIGAEKALIPEALQYLHFAFAGASGSGKSTAIEELISQAIVRGDKGFVIDINGAFYSKYGRPGDHVLSVRDPRAARWDFWHEELAGPENMAAAMIESDGGSTQYFWKGARALLGSLIRQNNSVEQLLADFQKSSKELREKLTKAKELSPRILGEGGSDQSDGVIGSTVLDLEILSELNQWNQSGEFFSITDWMNDNTDRSWTYVLVTDKDVEACKPLLRLWFDLACLAVLQRDSGNPNNLHTWLIIDEMKTVGQLPSLPSILDKGRKYKSSVVLGFQALSQIRKIYGEDDARSILQGIQNQFFFRMSEVESAQYVSEALGEHDVEQASFGMSFGPNDRSDRGSVSRAKARKKLVMGDEVRSLKTLQAFTKLSGHQPLKLHFEVKNRPRVTQPAVSMKNDEHRPYVVSVEAAGSAKDGSMPVSAVSGEGLPFMEKETRGELA